MTGKNFSMNNVSGTRRKSDFYETPYSMTDQFLDVCHLGNGSILEPAAGGGAIVDVLRNRGYRNVTHYDAEVDFLRERSAYDVVITNPPFSLAYEFIETAKRISREMVCLLLPLNYLHGKKRFDNIYQDEIFPLRDVFVFTRYPMLGDELREDGKYRTGMMVYAWYVWDRSHSGKPRIGWIDNNHYVLGARNVV